MTVPGGAFRSLQARLPAQAKARHRPSTAFSGCPSICWQYRLDLRHTWQRDLLSAGEARLVDGEHGTNASQQDVAICLLFAQLLSFGPKAVVPFLFQHHGLPAQKHCQRCGPSFYAGMDKNFKKMLPSPRMVLDSRWSSARRTGHLWQFKGEIKGDAFCQRSPHSTCSHVPQCCLGQDCVPLRRLPVGFR